MEPNVLRDLTELANAIRNATSASTSAGLEDEWPPVGEREETRRENVSGKIAEATRLVGARPQTFTATAFGPIIYAWMRNGRCLYIGQSGRGLRRAFASQHHCLRNFRDGDTLLVWPAPQDLYDREGLESALLRLFRPRLNCIGVPADQPDPPKRKQSMRERCIKDFRSPYFRAGVR